MRKAAGAASHNYFLPIATTPAPAAATATDTFETALAGVIPHIYTSVRDGTKDTHSHTLVTAQTKANGTAKLLRHQGPRNIQS